MAGVILNSQQFSFLNVNTVAVADVTIPSGSSRVAIIQIDWRDATTGTKISQVSLAGADATLEVATSTTVEVDGMFSQARSILEANLPTDAGVYKLVIITSENVDDMMVSVTIADDLDQGFTPDTDTHNSAFVYTIPLEFTPSVSANGLIFSHGAVKSGNSALTPNGTQDEPTLLNFEVNHRMRQITSFYDDPPNSAMNAGYLADSFREPTKGTSGTAIFWKGLVITSVPLSDSTSYSFGASETLTVTSHELERYALEDGEAIATDGITKVIIEMGVVEGHLPGSVFPTGKDLDRRLITIPTITEDEDSSILGLAGLRTVNFTLNNTDQKFNADDYLERDVRIWLAQDGTTYDEFLGSVTAVKIGVNAEFEVRELFLNELLTEFPFKLINTDDFPNANDLGQRIPVTVGRAIKHRCWNINIDDINQHFDYLIGEGINHAGASTTPSLLGTKVSAFSSGTSINVSHTLSAGDNRTIYALVFSSDSDEIDRTVAFVTYGSDLIRMNELVSYNGNQLSQSLSQRLKLDIYYLFDADLPGTGGNDTFVTFAGVTSECGLIVFAVEDARQIIPNIIPARGYDNSSSYTIDITTVVSNTLIIDFLGNVNASTASRTADAGQVETVLLDTGGESCYHSQKPITSPTATTMGWSGFASTDDAIYIAFEIEPVDGGSTKDITRVYRKDGVLRDLTGRAQAGATATITLAVEHQRPNAWWEGFWVYIFSGTGGGQYRFISNYDGDTNVATVDSDWGVVPDIQSDYQIRPFRLYRGLEIDSDFPTYAYLRFNKKYGLGDKIDEIYADMEGFQTERNFVRMVELILSNTNYGLGLFVNATSFSTAAAITVVTTLLCEGIFNSGDEAKDVLDLLLDFRGGRLSRSGLELFIDVDEASSSLATFGVSDDTGFNNIINFDNIFIDKGNIDSNIKEIRAKYVFDNKSLEYLKTLSRKANTKGVVKEIEYVYVFDDTTADTRLDYTRKKLIAETNKIDMLVGKEGVAVKKGDRITVNIPHLGVDTDYTILSSSRTSGWRYDLQTRLYNANIYSYEVGPDFKADERTEIPLDVETVTPNQITKFLITVDLTVLDIVYEFAWTPPATNYEIAEIYLGFPDEPYLPRFYLSGFDFASIERSQFPSGLPTFYTLQIWIYSVSPTGARSYPAKFEADI